MAKWFKEHLGFKSTKAPPPAPPKPDYRHCHPAAPGTPGTPAYHQQQLSVGATALYLSAAQPDILAAYRLQKERDFEDPYTGSGSFPGRSGSTGSPDIKYVSPKHRLIKVESIEKCNPNPVSANSSTPAASAGNVKSPTSPPAEQEHKHEKPVILEDYADPFDAKQTSGTQAAPEQVMENDGYMEPYEAQKMMAEIRGGRGAKEGLTKPLHLYDTPYEPVENGSDSDPERGTRPPRESRLPQDDERPPEEYDQPWEWKKDRISKAFAEIKVIKDLPWPPPVGQLNSSPPTEEGGEAPSLPEAPPVPSCQTASEEHNVQFDGAEKSRMSPTKEGKARPPQCHSSGSLSGVKLGSLDHSASLGERIDPTLPLENQFWYHGTISRTDAENLLRLCKEASYLVRNSETSKNDYSLSLNPSKQRAGRKPAPLPVLQCSSHPFGRVNCSVLCAELVQTFTLTAKAYSESLSVHCRALKYIVLQCCNGTWSCSLLALSEDYLAVKRGGDCCILYHVFKSYFPVHTKADRQHYSMM
ncbi:SH2 domain-containing adapter protein F-like isoform X2 [Acipenser ruthenus]|uniref:SH2 domain-containing adapter protein F-like isoform X2 n=1 Tax=Acipenser ruthenus TaxID=7906 RepID=UPI002741870C|nr:SH2 domain-containing adapter protein F-like isoform X2 [Acipenser ruthenus]